MMLEVARSIVEVAREAAAGRSLRRLRPGGARAQGGVRPPRLAVLRQPSAGPARPGRPVRHGRHDRPVARRGLRRLRLRPRLRARARGPPLDRRGGRRGKPRQGRAARLRHAGDRPERLRAVPVPEDPLPLLHDRREPALPLARATSPRPSTTPSSRRSAGSSSGRPRGRSTARSSPPGRPRPTTRSPRPWPSATSSGPSSTTARPSRSAPTRSAIMEQTIRLDRRDRAPRVDDAGRADPDRRTAQLILFTVF